MSIKRILKYFILILVVLGIGFGIYSFVKYEKNIKNQIIQTQQGVLDVINFSKTEFPDQVQDYVTKQSQSAVPQVNTQK